MKSKIIFSENSFQDLKKFILNNRKKASINFFNGVDIDFFTRIAKFKECLDNPKLININNVDGISVALPLSMKYFKRIERLQGPTFTDLFLKDKDLNIGKKHFFVGIEKENLVNVYKKYSNLKKENLFCYNLPYIKGLFFPQREVKKLINLIKKSRADYVWIGMGSPKQQILTNSIFDKVPSNNFFNVGVAMEFVKGSKKRAPRFFQIFGMEWLYRLLFSQFKLTLSRLYPSFRGIIKSFFIAKLE